VDEQGMTMNDLNELTREDLIMIDTALMILSRAEHKFNGTTWECDKATRALNRIAVRHGLVPVDGYAAQLAAS
jgi:hypothetical protein